jgi:predicted ester cyclase
MSAMPPAQRIELSPAVRAILETNSPNSHLLEHYVRFQQALIAHDPAKLDIMVTPDARCYELEAIGLPRGREGLRMFRRQVNAAIPDEHISITAVSFEGADIIEADLVIEATQTGEFLGVPATGRRIRVDVHERCRFVDGKLAERRAQVDFEDIKRKLTSPIQSS